MTIITVIVDTRSMTPNTAINIIPYSGSGDSGSVISGVSKENYDFIKFYRYGEILMLN